MNVQSIKKHFAMIKEGVPEHALPKLQATTEEIVLFLVSRIEALERENELVNQAEQEENKMIASYQSAIYPDGFGWE